MKNLCILFIVIISAPGIFSCTERIDIKLDESSIRFVVEGSLSTDTIAYKILLSNTTSFYYDQIPPAIEGASVSIISDGNDYQLSEKEAGVYMTDPTFYGIPGQLYELNINLQAPSGGYTEYTASSVMPETVKLDSVSLAFHADWAEKGIWEVKVYFQDPPGDDYYRFMIYRNGKLLTDTISKWSVTDDRFFNGSYVKGSSVAFLDQGSELEKLNDGDEVTVELNSIEKEYAEFIQEAQSEIRGTYPLFSGPPANVKGNISNGAIGFFTAYTSSKATTVARK